MKIAVPLFKGRVAPHFGSASKMLLVETDGAKIDHEVIREIDEKSPVELARLLVDFGVGRLVCGGFQNFHKDWLTAKGIIVMDNQRGIAKDVVRRLLKRKRPPV